MRLVDFLNSSTRKFSLVPRRCAITSRKTVLASSSSLSGYKPRSELLGLHALAVVLAIDLPLLEMDLQVHRESERDRPLVGVDPQQMVIVPQKIAQGTPHRFSRRVLAKNRLLFIRQRTKRVFSGASIGHYQAFILKSLPCSLSSCRSTTISSAEKTGSSSPARAGRSESISVMTGWMPISA